MRAARKLNLVADNQLSAEDRVKATLREIVPELLEAEQVVARLRNLMAEQGRKLAMGRGVAFIRPEQLRAEFGGCRGA